MLVCGFVHCATEQATAVASKSAQSWPWPHYDIMPCNASNKSFALNWSCWHDTLFKRIQSKTPFHLPCPSTPKNQLQSSKQPDLMHIEDIGIVLKCVESGFDLWCRTSVEVCISSDKIGNFNRKHFTAAVSFISSWHTLCRSRVIAWWLSMTRCTQGTPLQSTKGEFPQTSSNQGML